MQLFTCNFLLQFLLSMAQMLVWFKKYAIKLYQYIFIILICITECYVTGFLRRIVI